MNYLSIDSIKKSFGERILFENVSFGISQGEKVALVGVNGSGKSTLLNIIAGIDSPDNGTISFKKDISLAVLSQNPEFEPGHTVLESIFNSQNEQLTLIREYEAELELIERGKESMDKLNELIEKIDNAKAWDYEAHIKQILGKLDIHDFNQQIESLSGGQKKRVALAKILIEQPDFVIMDEPTNHLDLDIVEWLEDYLSKSNLSLLLVTHDRYFLENVTNSIIEIDRNSLYKYEGNYSYYLEKKEERETQLKTEVAKAKNLMKKELEWIRRQPKARGTKAKYRIEAFEEIKRKASISTNKKELELDTSTRRLGGKILELENINKSFGNKTIVHPFNYIFKKGEKIGIIGKNGAGKTTFLNLITGVINPDSGNIDRGQNTVIGYYTQQELQFDENQKVIDVVKAIAEYITLSDGTTITASQFLNHFLFPPKAQHDYVHKLSGGEKRRLQLLKVLILNPNFLILDEPTNDLDLISLSVLEEFLINYKGCLILVSHDRYFMDKLVDHVFVFEKEKPIKNYPFNYSQFRMFIENEELNQTEEISNKNKTKEKSKTPGKKLSYKEQQELIQLEPQIKELEQKKQELINKLNSGSNNFEELEKWSKQIDDLSNEISIKEMRWLELTELMETE